MVERHDAERAPDESEGVDVSLVGLAPAVEGDAELVRAARRGEELRLVDAERLVEQGDRGDGRLADADDADLVGFDQGHRHSGKAEASQRGRGHPPRRAATDNDDPALRFHHSNSLGADARRRQSATGAVTNQEPRSPFVTGGGGGGGGGGGAGQASVARITVPSGQVCVAGAGGGGGGTSAGGGGAGGGAAPNLYDAPSIQRRPYR